MKKIIDKLKNSFSDREKRNRKKFLKINNERFRRRKECFRKKKTKKKFK